MKFNLTITDATLDELRSFLGSASTPAIVKAALAPVVIATTSATESPVEPDEASENPEGAPAFDSAGFPWDERIHSANKGTNANGTWRKRRGVDDATVAAVEAELKARALGATIVSAAYATGGIVNAPAITPPLPTGEMVIPQIPASVQGIAIPSMERLTDDNIAPVMPTPVVMTPQQFAPVTPAMPEPVAPAPTPVIGATTIDFGGFMNAIAQKSSAGIIDNAYIISLTQRTGAAIGRQMLAITDVMTIPEGIAAAVHIMQQDGKW